MPDFPQRLLKPNHASKRPVRILCFDTETKGQQIDGTDYHKMYLAWTYYTRRDLSPNLDRGDWRYHTDVLSMCEYIESMALDRTTLYLVAHNIFFDLQSISFFHYFAIWGWRLDFVYDKGLTYVLIIRKGARTIKAISTTNYFHTSLEELGDYLGVQKLPISFDTDTIESISAYCHRDTEIVALGFAAWLRFIDEHDCGSFGLTRASQSFRAYRHRFMSTPIGVHNVEHIVHLERSAYMGGRVEAFQIGKIEKGGVLCFDINSMYPAVMSQHDFPHQLVDYRTDVELHEIHWLTNLFCIVAECRIKTTAPIYSVRHRRKLIFPIGEFTTYLTTPAIKLAMERGDLLAVERASFYKKAALFKAYIDYFYTIKQTAKEQGDTVTHSLVKIFLNSLYGKFGQSYTSTDYTEMETSDAYIRLTDFDMVDETTKTTTYLLNTMITEGETVNGKDSLVAIAAHVTEYARLLLWSIIESVGIDRVLYCDTDSVYIRAEDRDRITHPIHPTRLGALSNEGEYDEMIIHGAKDYVIDGNRKMKGVPKRSEQIGASTFRYDMFAGQATHLRESESTRYIIRSITKVLERNYDKGIVTDSGRVVPYRVPDDLDLAE